MKKRNIIILTSSVLSAVLMFLVLFFSIGRVTYKEVNKDVYAYRSYGVSKNVEIKDFYKHKKVTVIKEKLFKDNKYIETCTFGENILFVERLAFANCKNLKEVYFNSNIIGIDNNMFLNCKNLTKVDFGEKSNLKMIGASMFFNCVNLKEIEIPEKVEEIYTYAFFGCDSLESITIPSSVKYVYNEIFYGCDSLKEIIIKGTPDLAENWLYGAPSDVNVVYTT